VNYELEGIWKKMNHDIFQRIIYLGGAIYGENKMETISIPGKQR
jgi:hypothetical protein